MYAIRSYYELLLVRPLPPEMHAKGRLRRKLGCPNHKAAVLVVAMARMMNQREKGAGLLRVENPIRRPTQVMIHLLPLLKIRMMGRTERKTKTPANVTPHQGKVVMTATASERLKKLSFSSSLKDRSGELGAPTQYRPSCLPLAVKTTSPSTSYNFV